MQKPDPECLVLVMRLQGAIARTSMEGSPIKISKIYIEGHFVRRFAIAPIKHLGVKLFQDTFLGVKLYQFYFFNCKVFSGRYIVATPKQLPPQNPKNPKILHPHQPQILFKFRMHVSSITQYHSKRPHHRKTVPSKHT